MFKDYAGEKMKKMTYNGKVLNAYRINENGEIFYGKFNRKQTYFIHKGQFFINLRIEQENVVASLLDLILSNYQEKPQFGEYVAHLATHEFDSEHPFKVKNIVWKKQAVSMKSKIESISTDSLKGMKCVFIDGIAIGLMASKTGKIYNLQGQEKTPKIDRLGYPFIEIAMPFGLGKSKRKLVEIISEAYLLPYKDSICNYHFSYVDKNKMNCSTNNIMMWKEGTTGIAIKKTVRVFKEGKFFGIFDSVTTCAKILDIPRRVVSDMLKGESLNGFKVQEIKLF